MTEKDGKKVASVWWPDNKNEQGKHISASEKITLTWEDDFHGDHHISWIVEYRDGKEFARHNVRYIESIIWG